ncbi:MAG: hypothetical protein EAZ30_01640 [Betaproteobacteria bacterium]|nr:MAG: hypothetical protein EAZ30_01640 [Betaproteobacteria bacterium]
MTTSSSEGIELTNDELTVLSHESRYAALNVGRLICVEPNVLAASRNTDRNDRLKVQSSNVTQRPA